MTLSAISPSPTDPTPLFELFRGNLATELLTAAVVHFRIFERLSAGPLARDLLQIQELGLEPRPFTVLLTALRAMGLVTEPIPGMLDLTPAARNHLVPGSPFDISGYIGLAADSPGVLGMVKRLRSNKPANTEADDEKGAAFIYRAGLESAMEQEADARRLTLALAGRARICAPVLAQRVPLDGARLLLDVGGGTGLYSIALLQQNPALRAVVWDRPEVLKVAREMALSYAVSDRLECRAGDMFADAAPDHVDVVLFSNVLHDWDIPECLQLLQRSATLLAPGGRLLIHDVFLNDALDGPLPIALYSAALFFLTEGRAYSAAEYRGWLAQVGLTAGEITPTVVHCGVLPAFVGDKVTR